jgi:hypothetical protein
LRGEVLQAPEVDTQSLTNIGRTRPDDPGTKRQLPPDGISRHIADLERTVSALTEQVSALEARTRDHTRLTPQVATPKVPVHPKPQAPAPAAFWERNYLSRCYRWSRR